MNDVVQYSQESADHIRSVIRGSPSVGIILGTGLGNFARRIDNAVEVPYADIPHFPKSTVESHAGQMVSGELAGVAALVMEGRFHFYEGYSLDQVTFPVRVMQALGIKTLVVTNACGGLNPQYERGDIMVIEDHIGLLMPNPLIGPNQDALGPRFPDMIAPYDKDLLRTAEEVALQAGIRVQRGVYIGVTGPCLETRAEYRMLKVLGADAVGMSTVPEVIVATHAGIRVLGLSVITDMCLPDALEPVNIDEIIATANTAGPKLESMIMGVLSNGGV